jgi:hypothetical protein
MAIDYCVRIHIHKRLEESYMGNQIPNIAFQIAFCYQIGIGAKSDDDLRDKWLKKSNR